MSRDKPPTDEERRAKAFLDEAYSLETQADAVAFYDRWAEDYDRQVREGLRYVAPASIAAALARHLVPGAGPVLDVGCGTGLTGACLRDLGFGPIDGIDLSAAMLEQAREKGIYRNLAEADLNLPLALDDRRYAAVVCSGTFTEGHVGPEPIDELLRVLVAGGVLACTVHDRVWDAMGFSSKFERLESSGAVRRLERERDMYFEGAEKIAWYCVYEKL